MTFAIAYQEIGRTPLCYKSGTLSWSSGRARYTFDRSCYRSMLLETAHKEQADIPDSPFAALEAFPRIRNRNRPAVLAAPHCPDGQPPVVLAVSHPLDIQDDAVAMG